MCPKYGKFAMKRHQTPVLVKFATNAMFVKFLPKRFLNISIRMPSCKSISQKRHPQRKIQLCMQHTQVRLLLLLLCSNRQLKATHDPP